MTRWSKYRLRSGVMVPEQPDTTPGRLRTEILALFGDASLSAPDVAERLERPLGTIVYHLRALVDAGLLDDLPEEDAPLKDL